MKQHLIVTLKTTLVLVLITAGITGALQLYSFFKNNNTQELYDFTRDAELFHAKIEGSALLNDFDDLRQRVLDEAPEDSPEIKTLIMNGILSARGYGDQFGWLYPVTDALDILSSLKKESGLLTSCYTKLYLAWSEKESGHNSSYIEYCEEARQLFEQAMSLRAENGAYLDNLLSQLSAED
ncbi:MAG: hypothetical protein MUO19_08355 [Dehalococcoidales bacterium]|nr:hypothetical protein [Dehalococcoidales bacterium]